MTGRNHRGAALAAVMAGCALLGLGGAALAREPAGMETRDCPVKTSPSLPGGAVCLADVGMVAASPERYCDQSIELLGYWDRAQAGFFSSPDLAKHGGLFLGVVIGDDVLAETLGSIGPTSVMFARVTGRFDCSLRDEHPTVGGIKDIESFVLYPSESERIVVIEGGKVILLRSP